MSKFEFVDGTRGDGEQFCTQEAHATRSSDRLHFDYPYAGPIGDSVRQRFGAGYGDARFAVVVDNRTVFEGCTLDMERLPASCSIHFIRARELS